MRQAHVTVVELALQLDVVVAGHAQRRTRRDHLHDPPQHARRIRAAVDQITGEDRAAAFGRFGPGRLARSVDAITQSTARRTRTNDA